MFLEHITMSEIYMVIGFFLSMYACISNDVIQTLGTYLSANKKTPFYYMWAFIAIITVVTLLLGWHFNGGDISFGRLDRIPITTTFTFEQILPPICVLILTEFGIPVGTAFLILSVFTIENVSVIWLMLLKSFLGYGVAFILAIIIYNIIARPLERYFYYTQKRSGNEHISKWWMVAKWGSTAFIWSQWLMQDAANLFVYMPRHATFNVLMFVIISLVLFLGYVTYNRGGRIQNIVKMKTNVQDPRSATIIDLIYASLLLYFIQMNNIPMSTTWVFMGLLAGREVALYHRLRFESPKKMYKHIFKDFVKIMIGLVVSTVFVIGITQYRTIFHLITTHFM
jgi:hypothetical protein